MTEISEEAARQPQDTTTTVIVTERNTARNYRADEWTMAPDHALFIIRQGRQIAAYPPGTWTGVRDGDATEPDSVALALGTAKSGLREILATIRAIPPAEHCDSSEAAFKALTEVREIAARALYEAEEGPF